MRKGTFLVVILALVALISLAGCSKNSGSESSVGSAQQESASELAQQIGSLTIAAYGPDYITLKHQGDSSAVQAAMPTLLQAYIGINGKIAVRGSTVENSVAGPVDLASGSCTFRGLEPDQSYRIIVIAKNDAGMVAKYINPVRAEYAEIAPSDYLEMSDEEIGQLKWAFKIADDELDDFSRIESLNILGIPFTGNLQLGFCSYRYAIAFTTYFLATEQFHKLPACQEIIKPHMDRLIQKMLQKKVWQYWAVTSTGVYTFALEPNLSINYPSERDPVRIKNIMYSGHLAHMIALYEKMYGDMKWSQSGSIVFKWNDHEQYVYDNASLQKVLYDQFINLPAHCIECEPNACFPECNQHPILALKLYDQVHGTNLFDKAQDYLWDWFLKNEMIDPVTHETAAVFLAKQQLTLGPDTLDFGNALSAITIPLADQLMFRIYSAAADGWTGTFMHAWQPAYIEGHYPYQRQMRINPSTGRLYQDMVADQLAVAFFAMEASEMGDVKTRDDLLAQCDDLYDPQWDDGTYAYPVGHYDITINPTPYFTHYANSVTGQLVAIARANPKDGMLRMHNDSFSGASGPIVKEVDFDKAKLRRAIYDHQRDVLVITIDGGTGAQPGDSDMLKVERLDPTRTWHVKIDGIEKQRYSGISAINVEVPLSGRHDIILAAE